MKTLLWTVLFAACTSTTPPPTPSTPDRAAEPRGNEATPGPATPPGPSTNPPQGSGSDHHDHTPPGPKPAGGAAIGETCGPNDACVPGAECVKYYGIAGARGPQFKTCEIKCSGKGGTCPAGRSCVTIADGPGSVCR